MSDVFDELEILDEEIDRSPVGNSDVAETMSKHEKKAMSMELELEKTYPYLRITLDEESRMNALTKSALDSMFGQSLNKVKDGSDLVELAETAVATKVSIGVSLLGKEKVLGLVDVTQVRYVYNLLRNLKLSFEPEQGTTLDGSAILALI